MSPTRQRNLWRTAFLTVTAGALVAECWAAWDGNPSTDPWTDLITTYVPWQVAVAVFGALVLWVPVHFITAYRRKKRKIEWAQVTVPVVPADRVTEWSILEAEYKRSTDEWLHSMAASPTSTGLEKAVASWVLASRGTKREDSDPNQGTLF